VVTIVIDEKQLLAFSNAYEDDGLREIIFFLLDGPISQERMANMLKVSEEDLAKRLDRLREVGLVRRIVSTESRSDLYSLDFSLERPLGYPKPKTTRMLSDAIAEPIMPFLEAHFQELSALAETNGISLGRAIEQLLLSSFSRIMENYRAEIVEEDKRILEKFKGKN